MAAAWCLLWVGTARNEPPQLPLPPGTVAMSHLPEAASPAWPLMYPVIQAGQAMVAKAPFLKPAFQAGVNDLRLDESPAARSLFVVSQADFTAGLESNTRLLLL